MHTSQPPTFSLRAWLLPVALLSVACASGPIEQSLAPDTAVEARRVVPLGELLRVDGDLSVEPGEYLRPTADGAEAVIVLEGLRDVTVDLTDVILHGGPEDQFLETALGTGILVRDCREITIRGGELHGYRVCLAIEESRGVVIEDMKFEGWYSQRLASTIASASEEDQIDLDLSGPCWRGNLGAALWVSGSELVEVRRCSGRSGQNGILMVDSGHSEIYDNDFSFLSGWGLALWNSSANRVSNNIFDYNVRGYSHDVYVSDQNASGILLVGGSSDNILARNSATHCSVGARVVGSGHVAGTGPGCDRNAWIENDFRHAAVAGMLVDDSVGNLVLRNLLSGSLGAGIIVRHSTETTVVGNQIEDVHGRGISLLGCEEALVADNYLRGDQIGLEVAASLQGRPSTEIWAQSNEFAENDQDLVLKDSRDLIFSDNSFPPSSRTLYVETLEIEGMGVLPPTQARRYLEGRSGTRPSGFVQRSRLGQWDGQDHPRLYEARARRAESLRGDQEAFKHAGAGLGPLSSILVAAYGPWDFRSGKERPEVRFPGGLFADSSWDAVWFHWDPSSDPRGERNVWRAQRFTHVARATVSNFRNPWGSSQIRQSLGLKPFGLIASTQVELPQAGTYRLTVVSDDGVSLRFGEEVVLEDWVWHPRPKTHTAILDLPEGFHTVTLEYFQVEGAAALSIDLELIDA